MQVVAVDITGQLLKVKQETDYPCGWLILHKVDRSIRHSGPRKNSFSFSQLVDEFCCRL